jgi:tRNA(Ile)-lysidine synthase
MPQSLVVGLSGGLDSTVLLHLLAQLQKNTPQEFTLSAVHVHHGLQPAADDFVNHCQTLCEALKIPLQVLRVNIASQEISSLGVEAAARKYRYAAIAGHLPDNAVLVLAHHRDDLLETALLQWVRGAGLEGLSAMTAFSGMTVEGKTFPRWRPLLNESRESLLAYAQRNELVWVEDPSNDSMQFARNRIRREVMPVLKSLREGADAAMARSIGHLQTARELLDSLTEQALNSCVGEHEGASALQLSKLATLGQPMAARVVRAWLKAQGAPTPPARRLEEFLRQIQEAREPFAEMDLAHPATGERWTVFRSRDWLGLRR